MSLQVKVDASGIIANIRSLRDGYRERLPGALVKGNATAARIYLNDLQQQYDVNSRGGGDWAPLRPATVAQKGAPVPKLIESGSLRRSFEVGAPGNVFDVTADRIRVGTLHRLAKYHQHGTDRMVARRIVRDPTPGAAERMRAAILAECRVMVARDPVARQFGRTFNQWGR